MKTEEIDFIISTLCTAIEWSSYAPMCFQEKHRLWKDVEDVEKAKEILEKYKKELVNEKRH